MLHATNSHRQRSTRHPLGERPDASDPLVAMARRANLGARLELERLQRTERRPPDRIDELEREVERLRADLCEMWLGLPF